MKNDFFIHYGEELKNIAISSRIEQEKIRNLKKIETLKNKK